MVAKTAQSTVSVTPQESRQKQFLAKAAEAEQTANNAKDPQSRDSWLKIAQSYRYLAKTT